MNLDSLTLHRNQSPLCWDTKEGSPIREDEDNLNTIEDNLNTNEDDINKDR
jgi:hypothetical protein